MTAGLLLYGANGYSGRLITRRLLERGVRPILCGRDARRLAPLAEAVGLEYRVARLDDQAGLAAALDGVQVVLHAAGPFSETAMPMVRACLARAVHYLDITAEVRVIESLAQLDGEARQKQIMVMPAVGLDIVPSDCLCAYVARRLPGAERLRIGLSGLALMTRGSAKTFLQAWDRAFVRRDGVLTQTALGALRHSFDFGRGPRPSLNICWGDAVTAWYTTGIPNIETYCESNPVLESAVVATRSFGWALGTSPWQRWFGWLVDTLPEGPSEAERERVQIVIVAEATDRSGRRVCARLRTPEAYSFTAVTSAAVAARVLRGDLEPGFQTPGRVYGPDFVLGLDGVQREDLE